MVPEIPLCMVPEGKRFRVARVKAGRGLARRLIELGFTGNAALTVVKSQSRGPLIVQLNNSRFALGRGMAMKIMVEEL